MKTALSTTVGAWSMVVAFRQQYEYYYYYYYYLKKCLDFKHNIF